MLLVGRKALRPYAKIALTLAPVGVAPRRARAAYRDRDGHWGAFWLRINQTVEFFQQPP